MTGRAKWDAWNDAGKKYTSAADAKARYLQIARDLGWSEEAKPEPTAPTESTPANSIWDDDSRPSSGKGSSGMGPSVSSMKPPDTAKDNTIHGFAVSNDVEALKSLLKMQTDIDVNQHDEYVRRFFLEYLLAISSHCPRDLHHYIWLQTGGTKTSCGCY